MPTSALDVYQSAQRVAATGRQLEAVLLFKAARQLDAVVKTWDAPDLPGRLRTALEYNTKLWSVFQASMEDPENALPHSTRINILHLVRFIDRRTLEVLAAPAPVKLQAIIEIDRQIAMGLSTSVESESETGAVEGAAA